jgi:hypothetical protein
VKRRDRERAPTVRLIRTVPEPQPQLEPVDEPQPQLEPVDDLERRVGLMKPILTFVLGSTTGWAVRWDEDHIASGTEVFAFGERTGTRLLGFRDWLRELLDLTNGVLVAYEDPSSKTGRFVHNLEGVLLTELEGRASYVCPKAADVAKHVIGRRAASSSELIAAAAERWKKEVTSAQEARALGLLSWVLDVVGEPR